MNKTLISFLLFVGGLLVFHNVLFPIFTPKEIGWVMNRYVYFLLICAFLIIVNLALNLKPPISMNALYVWCLGFYFYKFILFPPIPWTLFITYMMLWSIGTFLYISQDPKTFREFRKPIVMTIIGEWKMARIVVFIALPVLVGFGTYKAIYPTFAEPVELRDGSPCAASKYESTWYDIPAGNHEEPVPY